MVGTTRGYDSHLIATGAGSCVTSNFLSVGTELGARSTLAIEDGAVLNTAFDARIGNGSGPGETDTLSPKATVTGPIPNGTLAARSRFTAIWTC